MKVAARSHQLRSARVLRLTLLIAVTWLLGLTNLFHTHAEETAPSAAMRTHIAVIQGGVTAMSPDVQEDACAICDWKDRTPYSSAPLPLFEPLSLPHAMRTTIAPRTPPTVTAAHYFNRAPPSFLS